jgi:uncharacterized membrane protein (DUF485 family)
MTSAVVPRQRKTWDLVLTIVLLLLYLVWSLLCAFAGAMLAMASDGCGAASSCDYNVLANAFLIGSFGPVVLALPVLVVAIVLIVLKRIAFWVPLAGGLLALGIEIFSFALASSGVVGMN